MIELGHEFRAVKHGILKLGAELYCLARAGGDTQFAKHTATEVIFILGKAFFLFLVFSQSLLKIMPVHAGCLKKQAFSLRGY